MSQNTATDTEQKSRNKLNIIIAIFLAISVIVAIIIAIIVNVNINGTLNDEYFVSDGHKYVTSVIQETPEELTMSNDPLVTHYVYYYSGDKLTAIKVYMKFNSNSEAKIAEEELAIKEDSTLLKKSVNGKYLVFETDPEAFKDISLEDVRTNLEQMKQSKNYAEYVNGEWKLINQQNEEETK